MNAEDWNGIYADADSSYRAEIPAAESEAIFRGVERKLGKVTETHRVNFFSNVNAGTAYLSVTYETHFSGGDVGTETMSWRRWAGQDYHLQSYNVNSMALLTK